VIVVTTINSWHSNPPLPAVDAAPARRTVNINLLRG
jgi:hypothetical protein